MRARLGQPGPHGLFRSALLITLVACANAGGLVEALSWGYASTRPWGKTNYAEQPILTKESTCSCGALEEEVRVLSTEMDEMRAFKMALRRHLNDLGSGSGEAGSGSGEGSGDYMPSPTPPSPPPPSPPPPSPPSPSPSPAPGLPPPAPGVAVFKVSTEFMLSGSPADYDAAAQTAIKTVLATAANVSPSAVSLNITAASVLVAADIFFETQASASAGATSLSTGVLANAATLETALNTQFAAAGLGTITVSTISTVPQVVVLMAPPIAPPPVAPSAPASDSSGAIIGVVVALVVLLVFGGVVVLICKKKDFSKPPFSKQPEGDTTGVHA